LADAQSDTATSHQKDLLDIFSAITKDKFKRENPSNATKAAHSHWSLVPGLGYTLQNGFAASVSANNSFYASNTDGQNMSTLNSSVVYTQKHQFSAVVQPNLWSKNNKMYLTGDYRFLIYPQLTYGLGGHTQLADETQMEYNFIRLNQTVYRKFATDLYAGIGYTLNYHYHIRESAASDADSDINTTSKTDFQTYDGATRSISSGVSLNFLFDKRRNQVNPVAGGKYLSVQFTNYLRQLGSTAGWQSLIVDARRYLPLGHKGNKLALWEYGWFTFNGDAPYLDLPSTGWDANNNLGRGYIQSRFRGKRLLYSEAEYRMNITTNHLIGGVLFANAQSVADWPSNAFTVVHPGFGAGLRIKFNKVSNTNIALDYAFGTDGSKGIFVNLGEVF
jgi:hypothetical protein